jgi:3-phosphoshikimate 1-carboxyvinyltransferase
MPAVRIEPVSGLRGTVRVPPDKSLTHRALLLAGVSDREVRIGAPLASADTEATRVALEACRVPIEGALGAELRVRGRGLRGLAPPPALDCANAGTLMRLLAGLLVGQRGDHVVLDGDDSLRRRPMDRVARPLRAMGAGVWTAPGGTPPLVVAGDRPLRAMRHRSPVASAQVKSCLLLAGLYAEGETWVEEPGPSRDHTERMLEAAGVPVLRDGELAVGVRGPVEGLALPDLEVPGDPSSAAFLVVAGALRAETEVRLEGVNLNRRRTGLLAVAGRMGVPLRLEQGGTVAGEPAGDVVVARAGTLHATEVAPEEVPTLIDELPLVGLLAAFAAGTTTVRGADELRVKESDRIGAVVAALRALGVRAEELEDGFAVTGGGRLVGGVVRAGGDHRMAMLGAIAGLASAEGVLVEGFEAAEISYPGFAADLSALSPQGGPA